MKRLGPLLGVVILSVCGAPMEPDEMDRALTAEADSQARRGPSIEDDQHECRRHGAVPGPTETCRSSGPQRDEDGTEQGSDSPSAPEPADRPFLANEPVGMVEVFGNNSSFPEDRGGPNRADGDGSSHDSWGWRSSGRISSVDPQSEGIPTSPAVAGADNVWVGVFPAGHAPGTGPFSVAYNRPSHTLRRSMYWSMYLYFSDPFDFNTCVTKGFWMAQSGHNNHFLPIYRGGTAFGVYLQFNDWPRDTEPNRNYDGMPSVKLSDRFGTWFHMEVLMVANTIGQEDGRYRLWIDGELEVEHDTIYYFDEADFDNGRDDFDTIRLNPTWGCLTGGSVRQRQYIAIDDWYASSNSSRVH